MSFNEFREKKVYETHLKEEIIKIITSLHYLEIPLPFELHISESKLSASPEFYVITLNSNARKAVGNVPNAGDVTLLFSTATVDNIAIDDIIDDDGY